MTDFIIKRSGEKVPFDRSKLEKRGAWRAKIRIGRKTMHIGYYSSLSVAAKARLEYEDNFHYANE